MSEGIVAPVDHQGPGRVHLQAADGMIGIWDSAFPEVIVSLPPEDIALFLGAAKAGEYDYLVQAAGVAR